ncbi:unnamed protein product [Echinostoma caproni]|uniref:DDT domain-containing protein n=1 Tax=Echinostoma caproni TaxID=27848 RepID=A0A183B005_9TREM|nr:unnamed protein product [Echinostoma caproni]
MSGMTQEQLERAERAKLERDWLSVRRREDLELSDLVPLPDLSPPIAEEEELLSIRPCGTNQTFTRFTTRLPSSSIGAALQLLEFFHNFGSVLDLYVPNSSKSRPNRSLLSWQVLEQALVDPDPCGPLADLFISLLLAIRRFETDLSSRRASLNIPPAMYSAANVVASAEVGSPFNLPVISSGCAPDSSGLFDDLLLAPVSVYDLSVDEKLILLNCLVDQLLMHPVVRDRVDERAERHRFLRIRLRMFRCEQKGVTGSQSGEFTDHAVEPNGSAGTITGATSSPSVADRLSRDRSSAFDRVVTQQVKSGTLGSKNEPKPL